ncbi:MAG: N-acetylglucosamine-6-phosphate deacetylase [Caldilineales bacterium]
MLYIQNATVYAGQEWLDPGAVLVNDGRIAAVGRAAETACPTEAQVLDADGLLLVPGFIDLQFNGGFGCDFTADPTTIWQVASGLPRWGATAFLPTVITSPLERVAAAQQVIASRPAGFRGAAPLGLHVEGPFLNPQKKGAHNPAYLRNPSLEAVTDWSPQTGVRLVTLAPELPGALPVVEALASRGVLVSAGHSTATFDQAVAAFDAGARYGTHLFNAMPTLLHREPGLPGALLTDPRPVVGLIADGIHTHPAIVSLVWRALGTERLNLVTDAMAALGMGPGTHLLGDFEVTVDATSARLADGTLAGSILSLDQALRNLIKFTGCSLSDALATVTTTPARALGLDHERGQIAAGYVADLVLLSPDLEVRGTVVAGELVYTAE